VDGHLLALALPLLVLLLAAHGTAAEEVPLPIEEGRWQERLFGVADDLVEQAATFGIAADEEKGPCLAIERWCRGRHMARFEFADALPMTQGTIRGYYRTEDIGPYGGAVSIDYLNAGRHIVARSFWLGPASEWTAFEFAFRVVPPGADAIRPSCGLAGKTAGKILFVGLVVSAEAPPPSLPDKPPDATRAPAPDDFQATGFFRLAERDGTWWLVTPDGKGIYSVGTDAPWMGDGGEAEAQRREYVSFYRKVGFNSLAGWSDIRGWAAVNDALEAAGERPFAAFPCLGSGRRRADFDQLLNAAGRTTGADHAFPDPFDPRFEKAYRGRAARLAELVRGKSWFAGYFADNEVGHKYLFGYVYSPHCAAAFRAFLTDRHSTIAALNERWGTAFASFEDIVEQKPDPTICDGAMYEDFRLFEREIVSRYVEVTLGAIRAEDPDHLVFTNRFMLDDVERWPLLLDLYEPFDGIAINIYPSNQSAGLNDHERSVYRLAHEITGKPIIVGEWSVPAADSGLYDDPEMLDWSWNELVETQAERARQAACVAADFYNMPFMVGAHWFTWKDIVDEQRRANRGLFAADGKPWQEVIDSLRNAHREMGLPVPYE
jgi:hypothetical protein